MSKKTPEIRFKGFTDDWEQRKLGENAEILTGGTPKTSINDYWEPKEVSWMSSGEVNKRRIFETDNKISKKGLENSSARWVKKNSILIALAGQGKTRGTVAINSIPLTTNQSIAAICPNEKLNYEFVFQNLIKRYDELRLISSGDGTRGGLNKKIVSDISISSPIIEEQIKIGNFFKQLDETITLHQAAIQRQQDLKKGLLQKIFPAKDEKIPAVRFTSFTEEWEQRKVDDYAQKNYGGGTPKTTIEEFWDGDIDWIQSSDLTEHRVYNVVAKKYITQRGLNNSAAKLVPANSIAIVTRVGVGKISLMLKEYATSQDFLSLSKLNVDKDFGVYSLYKKLQSEIHAVQGTSIKGITKEELLNKKVMIPSDKNEQIKIGSFFKKMDNAITLHQQAIDKLKKLKQSLLQKMFI